MKFAFLSALTRTVRSSVWDPLFYGSLPTRDLGFSIGYFVSFSLWLSLIVTVVLGSSALPAARTFFDEAGPVLIRTYPPDLVITIENHRASVNLEEPVVIPLPDEVVSAARSVAPPIERLLVIDTKEPFSSAQFEEYRTFLWLTADTLFVMDDRGVRAQPLRDLPDMTIDRAAIVSLVANLDRIASFLPPLVILGIFIFVFGILSLAYLEALVGGLLVFVVARRMQWKYRTAYQAALHALTLPTFFVALRLAGFPDIPFLSVALFVAVVAINLIPLSRRPVSVAPHEDTKPPR